MVMVIIFNSTVLEAFNIILSITVGPRISVKKYCEVIHWTFVTFFIIQQSLTFYSIGIDIVFPLNVYYVILSAERKISRRNYLANLVNIYSLKYCKNSYNGKKRKCTVA